MNIKKVELAIERLQDHMSSLIDYRICDNDLNFHTTSSDWDLINSVIEFYKEKNEVINKAIYLLEEVILEDN